MQNRIPPEAIEQADDIVNGERELAATNQLHGLAVLQIDAGNNHGVLSPPSGELIG